MATTRFSRRQMLRGAGGVAVGIPFLPSLLPRRAWAQPMPAQPKRFVAINSNHGGVDNSAMFPSQSVITEEMDAHPGHRVRRGALVRTESGGMASVSEVLSAPSDVFTEQLVSKMNVYMGLDVPFYIGHHRGGHLGDYARNDGNGADGQGIRSLHMPTIDQVMAYSSTFYDDLAGVTARTVLMGDVLNHVTANSTPGNLSSNLIAQYTYQTAGEAFDFLFPNPQQQSDGEERPSIIDRVIESYRSLRQSNRRLSADDRQRLEDHVARLHELDRRLNTTLSCSIPDQRIGSYGGNETIQNLDDMVEVASLALVCGATRIAVLSPLEYVYVNYSGNWHDDVAHQHFSEGPQQLLRQANQALFERYMVRLASAFDVDMGDGTTLLDNSLIHWSQESGQRTHEAVSLPVVTFGSAGGAIRTGQFYDYRNLSSGAVHEDQATGLLYNQYLANLLMAMDVPESEWANIANNGDTGYGVGLVNDGFANAHAPGVVSGASDWLPWLRG